MTDDKYTYKLALEADEQIVDLAQYIPHFEGENTIYTRLSEVVFSYTFELSHVDYMRLMMCFGLWTWRDYLECLYPQARQFKQN